MATVTYDYKAPDGNTYEIDGDEGKTTEEIQAEGDRRFSNRSEAETVSTELVDYDYTASDGNVYSLSGSAGKTTEEIQAEGDRRFTVMKEGTQGQAKDLSQWFGEAAQRGFTKGMAFGEAAIDTFVLDPFFKRPYETLKAAVTGDAAPAYSTGAGGIGERWSSNYDRVFKAMTPYTGVEPNMVAPENSGYLTHVVASGIEAASDPLNYLGLGALKTLATTGVKALAKKTASDSFTLFNLGVGMDVGGKLGEGVQKAWTGEETGTAGKVVGSLGFGAGSVVSSGLIKNAIITGGSYAKQLWQKYKNHKNNPTAAAEAYSSGAAKRLLDFAANEKNLDKWDDVVNDFAEIAPLLGRENFPLLVSMSDNAVLRDQVIRRAKQSPAFKAQVQAELLQLTTLIDEKAHSLFGPQYAVFNIALAPQVVKEQAQRAESIISIDNKIQELTKRFETAEEKATIGTAIENLVKAKQAIAKQENGVTYDALLAEAAKAGSKSSLPKEAVRDVYNFITANNFRDIFGKGTPLDKKILNIWGPKEELGGAFAAAPFAQVESLKKAINLELAQRTPGTDSFRKLAQLKEVLSEARTQIKGNFNQRLIDLDRLYYEKVGVPFGEQGVKDLTAKKYAEQVAPVIVKNAESLDDFIGAVGEEGVSVARTAVLSEMYQKVFTDGVLSPTKFRQYMRNKAEVIDRIPGLRQELNVSLFDDAALKLKREALNNVSNAADAQIAKNYLLKNPELGPNYSQIVEGMIGNNDRITQFYKNLDDLAPEAQQSVINTVRAELFHIARNSDQTMYGFLINPANRSVVSKLFGAKYTDQLKSIAKLSDALKLADVSTVSGKVTDQQMDGLARLIPGMDIPYLASTLRDRISSRFQKGVRLVSRFSVATGKGKTDEAIERLLLDPEGVAKLDEAMKNLTKNKGLYDTTFTNPRDFKTMVGVLTELIPSYFYETTKQGIEEEE